jgi:hypothetical protein
VLPKSRLPKKRTIVRKNWQPNNRTIVRFFVASPTRVWRDLDMTLLGLGSKVQAPIQPWLPLAIIRVTHGHSDRDNRQKKKLCEAAHREI